MKQPNMYFLEEKSGAEVFERFQKVYGPNTESILEIVSLALMTAELAVIQPDFVKSIWDAQEAILDDENNQIENLRQIQVRFIAEYNKYTGSGAVLSLAEIRLEAHNILTTDHEKLGYYIRRHFNDKSTVRPTHE